MSVRATATTRFVAVALACAAGTACTTAPPAAGGPDGGRPTPTGSTTADSSQSARDPSAAESASVERAYRRFWAVAQGLDRLPVNRWRTTLATVAAEPILSELLDGLAEQRARGIVEYGTVVPHPTVAYLRSDQATVVDCQDASRSGEVDQATGVIQHVGSARTPLTAVLRRDGAGGWRVTEARYLPEPC